MRSRVDLESLAIVVISDENNQSRFAWENEEVSDLEGVRM